jgi:excisionase family DNA binding protein
VSSQRDKEFFSTHDAAKVCRVTPMTVIRWIKEGKLPAFTTAGGHRRIARSDLCRFCKARGIPSPPDAQASAGRILIVDADTAARDIVSDVARAVDDKLLIEVAGDAWTAGHAMATFRPQLVFLEQRLPSIDAVELCARIVRRDDAEPTSIVVMVPQLGPDVERLFRARGALGCMLKPPVAATVERYVRAVFHPAEVDGQPMSVLIIDPDARAGRSTRRELETRLPGCRVSLFESAVEGLMAIPIERPEIVLMDGADVQLAPAELVRRLCMQSGARGFFIKPWAVEEILTQLRGKTAERGRKRKR